MPFAMGSYPAMVVIKGKVYIGGGWAPSHKDRQTVMEYDPRRDKWATLPQYNCTNFGMAVWKDHLVLVGGINVATKEKSSKLGVLDNTSWTYPLPSMPTARRSPTVITFDKRWLVVIGGKYEENGTQLTDVEVLDTTSDHWYKGVPLPQPLSHASAGIIGSTCYVLGGFSSKGSSSKTVFSIPLNNLITQALSASAPASPSQCHVHVLWQTLPDTPFVHSTALALNGALMAIGGESALQITNRAIYLYQSSSKRWFKIGELPTRRTKCACTVLSNGAVIVAGGSAAINSSLSQAVEIAEFS